MTRCTTCQRPTLHCRKCHHRTFCEFCNTCNTHGQEEPDAATIKPEPNKRVWLVEASFLVRSGWTAPRQVRVRAKGLAGAVWHGVRQARREALKPRTRVQQVKMTVLPV